MPDEMVTGAAITRGRGWLSELRLSDGDVAQLIEGPADDVAFEWTLIDLGTRSNPPPVDEPPYTRRIAAAFVSVVRLVTHGLMQIGRLDDVAPDAPPGPTRR